MNDDLKVRPHYVFVLKGEDGKIKDRWTVPNVVTTSGKGYVAKKMAGTAIADTAADPNYSGANGRLLLLHKATGTVTPAVGDDYSDTASYDGSVGLSGWDAGYPLVSDPDTDNSSAGPGVCSFRVTYSGASFSQTDLHGVMVVHSASSGSDPILSHANFASKRDKTASDILKVFYNVSMT